MLPPTPDRKTTNGHLLANQVLMAMMLVLSLLSMASVALNLLLAFAGDGSPLAGFSDVPTDPAERAGFFSAFAVIGCFALAGIIWTPINLWGLYRRASWARWTSIVYWIGSLLTCLCIPIGVYGIISLTRPAVRDLFPRS
jgi:hypothetical protein